jgi:hypothetical protein
MGCRLHTCTIVELFTYRTDHHKDDILTGSENQQDGRERPKTQPISIEMTDRSESENAGGGRCEWARIFTVAFLSVMGLLGSVTKTKHTVLILPNQVAGKDQSDAETTQPNKREKFQEERYHLRHNTLHRHLELLQRGGFVNCSEYQYSLSITDKLKVKYVVNAEETAPGKGTISVQMEYFGVGWLGFAHSESGIMVGSLGIVGLPDEELRVQKFKLGGIDVGSTGGISPLMAHQQTLINSALEQTEQYTVMRFTKLLMEPDELSIHPNLQNTFLFAHGASNTFGYHATRGVAVLDLQPCVQSVLPGEALEVDTEDEKRRYDEDSYVVSITISPLDGGSSPNHGNVTSESVEDEFIELGTIEASVEVVEAPEISDVPEQFAATTDRSNDSIDGSYTSQSTSQKNVTRLWWTFHGVCATLACGVLLPLVVGSSLLQGCCGGRRGNHSFSHVFHRWSNALVLFAVLATIITAIIGAHHDSVHAVAFRQEHRMELSNKPETSHRSAGVALFIIIFFYALIGSLRSCLTRTSRTSSKKDECKPVPLDLKSEDIENTNLDLGMARFATHYDQCHCIVGVALIGLSCWQCQAGLNLFEDRFQSWFTTAFFWSISGTCLGIVGLLYLLQMVSEWMLEDGHSRKLVLLMVMLLC